MENDKRWPRNILGQGRCPPSSLPRHRVYDMASSYDGARKTAEPLSHRLISAPSSEPLRQRVTRGACWPWPSGDEKAPDQPEALSLTGREMDNPLLVRKKGVEVSYQSWLKLTKSVRDDV